LTIIKSYSKGADFVILSSGGLSKESTNRWCSLLVAKDSPINKIEDLKGRSVGIYPSGCINHLSMYALADKHNLDINDFKLIVIPFSQMEDALKKGIVDAILAVEPIRSQCISHRAARYLDKSIHESFGEEITVATWFAKKSWVETNPQKVRGFIKALNKAIDFMESNINTVMLFLLNNTELTPDLVREITLPAFSKEFEPSMIQPMIDLAAKYKFIPKAFPADKIMYKYIPN